MPKFFFPAMNITMHTHTVNWRNWSIEKNALDFNILTIFLLNSCYNGFSILKCTF